LIGNPAEVNGKRKLFRRSWVYNRGIGIITDAESMFLVSPGGMGKKIGPILGWNQIYHLGYVGFDRLSKKGASFS
jgi:hypothetical protein